VLQRKIDAWVKFQALYYPGVERLRTDAINESNRQIDIKPYGFPLWLPSQINMHQAHIPNSLQKIEWKLRYAQAHEALRELRHQLQVCAYLFKFKDRFVRGQGANTCARNAISGVQARIDSAAEEYRNSRDALQSLAPNLIEFQWKEELLPLMPEDIRDLSEGKAGVSEGKRTISWIWWTVTKSNDESSNKSLLDREMLI
jgi:DNA polymerase III delta prime subunit